jgi:hypothetical protein
MFSRLCSLSLIVVCLTAVAACSEAPARGGVGGAAAYTGTGTFVLENFYAVAAIDAYAGFGTAPTYDGCP